MASIHTGFLTSVHSCLQLIDDCCKAQILDKDTLSGLHEKVDSILTIFQEKQRRTKTEIIKNEISTLLKKWEKIKAQTSSIHNFNASKLASLASKVKTALASVHDQSIQQNDVVFFDGDVDGVVPSDEKSNDVAKAPVDPFDFGLDCIIDYCKDPNPDEQEEFKLIQKWVTRSLEIFQQQKESTKNQHNQKMIFEFITLFKQLLQAVYVTDENFSPQTVLNIVNAIKEKKQVEDRKTQIVRSVKDKLGIIAKQKNLERATKHFCEISEEEIHKEHLATEFATAGISLCEKSVVLEKMELALKIRAKLGETRLQETCLAFINGYLQRDAIEQARKELSEFNGPTFQTKARHAITQYCLSRSRVEEALSIAFPQECIEKDTLILAQSLCIRYWLDNKDFDTAFKYLKVMSENETKEQLSALVKVKTEQTETPGSKKNESWKEEPPAKKGKFE